MYKMIKIYNEEHKTKEFFNFWDDTEEKIVYTSPEIVSADYSIVYKFDFFDFSKKTEKMLLDYCNANNLDYDRYIIIEVNNSNNPQKLVGVFDYSLTPQLDMPSWIEHLNTCTILGTHILRYYREAEAKMPIKLEIICQNGKPNKKYPLCWGDVFEGCGELATITTKLKTYEQLIKYKKKKFMLDWAYSMLQCYYVALNLGVAHTGRIAVVAYNRENNEPIWVAVADDRTYNRRRLRYKYYNPATNENRREYAWAIRKRRC